MGVKVALRGNGVRRARPTSLPSETNFWLKPRRAASREWEEERRRRAEVMWRLLTIHPNPGPRVRTEGWRKRRMEDA